MIAESSSRIDPLSAKEKGDPGRKVLLRSPSNRSEGCSLICCRAVTGERNARTFFISILLLLLGCCGCGVGGGGAGAGAGAGDGAL